MTGKQFALSVGLGQSTWYQVLSGKRNLGWRNAKRVARKMGGDPHIWREGGTKAQRLARWEHFVAQELAKETA